MSSKKEPVDGHIPLLAKAHTHRSTVHSLCSEGSWWKRGQRSLAEKGSMPRLLLKKLTGSVRFLCPLLPLPGASKRHSPLGLVWPSELLPVQEVAEPLKWCQNRLFKALGLGF